MPRSSSKEQKEQDEINLERLPHGYVLAQFLPEASSARREIAAILRRTDATIDR